MNYISIKQILDDLTIHPLLRDIGLERVVNYTLQFIKLVGSPKLFDERTAELLLKDYRAVLPCDCLDITGVMSKEGLAYIYTTDTFFTARKHKDCPAQANTYKVLGNVIYTDHKEGTIMVAYRAVPLDKHGFPCVPDEVSFIEGLKAYIKVKLFEILFEMQLIPQLILANAQQEYAWYVAQTQSKMAIPSYDDMEALKHMWTTMIQRNNHHDLGFKNLGKREHYNIH